MTDFTNEQIDYLDEKLGLNLGASERIANDLLEYFVARCEEEDIGSDDMLMIASAFNDRVKDAYTEGLK